MKRILLFGLICSFFKITNGQAVFAVESGTNTVFYSNLDDAIINAVSGATIYLPAGTYTLEATDAINLHKELHFIGVGYHPDSTLATGISRITNYFAFYTGSDNSSIIGIDIDAILMVTNVQNIFISRCKITSLSFFGGPDANSKIILSECVVLNSITANNTGNISDCVVISNNSIFQGQIAYLNDSQFVNCIFLYKPESPSPLILVNKNSVFQNSIFIGDNSNINGCVGCNNQFINNLFVNSNPQLYGDIDLNNIKGILAFDIFVSQSGNTYNYKHDYHLKPTCLGNDAGSDGTDVGIFGSITPFKVGGLPVNPHVALKQIGSSTDQNGKLPLNIKIVAQDH